MTAGQKKARGKGGEDRTRFGISRRSTSLRKKKKEGEDNRGEERKTDTYKIRCQRVLTMLRCLENVRSVEKGGKLHKEGLKREGHLGTE